MNDNVLSISRRVFRCKLITSEHATSRLGNHRHFSLGSLFHTLPQSPPDQALVRIKHIFALQVRIIRNQVFCVFALHFIRKKALFFNGCRTQTEKRGAHRKSVAAGLMCLSTKCSVQKRIFGTAFRRRLSSIYSRGMSPL